MLVHIKNDSTRKTDKHIVLELNPGNMQPCDACATGKYKWEFFFNKSDHEPETNKE